MYFCSLISNFKDIEFPLFTLFSRRRLCHVVEHLVKWRRIRLSLGVVSAVPHHWTRGSASGGYRPAVGSQGWCCKFPKFFRVYLLEPKSSYISTYLHFNYPRWCWADSKPPAPNGPGYHQSSAATLAPASAAAPGIPWRRGSTQPGYLCLWMEGFRYKRPHIPRCWKSLMQSGTMSLCTSVDFQVRCSGCHWL